MMRREDWPERLYDYVESRRDTPFDWATNSCASFAAAAVEAMTDEAVPLPAFATTAEAAALLAERSLRDRVGDVMGPEIVPSFAQRGDLVLIDIEGRESVAVCLGLDAVGPGTAGIVLVPMSAAIAAWGA
jgi:hypothetical protein